MAAAELLMERCMEEIATTVLDAGGAISYRTLGASSQVNADVSRLALDKFAQENESSVGAIQVVVQRGVVGSTSSSTSHKSCNSAVDPRARVIRIGSFSSEQSAEKVISKQIYSVYKKSAQAVEGADGDAVEPIAIACWSQERSLRNDIFQKVAKQAPLSRAIKSFYESGIKCVEATTRTGFGESQGEESVSVFDSLKASKMPASSSVISSSARNSSSSTPSTASSGSKSFFKSTGSATSTFKPRATSSTISLTRTTPAAAKQPETKKIDAKSMSNVFTIDSDDDDDGSDADAPVFVKKSQSGATAKPRSKRVISDDEDEDDDDFAKPVGNNKSAKTPVAQSKKTGKATSTSNSSSSRSVKRKLSTSPDEKNHVTLSDSDDQVDEPKRTKRAKSIENMDDEDDEDTTMAEVEEVEEEEEEAPVEIQTKRRVETTKTRINEQGYMVTEKTVEEVELTAEEIEQEKLQAAKKKKQQQAAKAAAEAARATAEKKAAAAVKGGAPAKQKNLFAFFQRK